MPVERGAIRNREHATQIRDFTGLQFGKITPTDIDAFMEFGDSVFIFIECKHGSAKPKPGQALALDRLADACWKAGKNALLLFCRHDSSGDVPYAGLPVTGYRMRGVTTSIPYRPITVKEACEEFIADWDLGPHTQWPRPPGWKKKADQVQS